MSTLGTYELTHPESLTESELKEILENRCIDFSNYKNLSRHELVELYKRVALPLPQRQSENSENSRTTECKEGISYVNEGHTNSITLNGTDTTEKDICDLTKIPEPCGRSKSLMNDPKQTSKTIRLENVNNITKCNGISKHSNDEKQDVPPRKRQKITWP